MKKEYVFESYYSYLPKLVPYVFGNWIKEHA